MNGESDEKMTKTEAIFYYIKSPEEVGQLSLEGKMLKITLKDGRIVEDGCYYQGNLDFEKLNNNQAIHSVGYDYLTFIDAGEVRYDEIMEMEIIRID